MSAIAPSAAPGPVLHLRRPSDARILAAARAAADAPLSYDAVGSTADAVPAGFRGQAATAVVGHGEAAWTRAAEGLRAWRHFDLPWVVLPAAPPVRVGEPVAFASWTLGVWSVNACRIVSVVERATSGGHRLGFAIGTVDAHALSGEERFLVSWDHATDAVRFEIRSFSRPRHPVVAAAAVLARRVQTRFTREALAALGRHVREGA